MPTTHLGVRGYLMKLLRPRCTLPALHRVSRPRRCFESTVEPGKGMTLIPVAGRPIDVEFLDADRGAPVTTLVFLHEGLACS